MFSRTFPRLLGPAQRLRSTPDALVSTRTIRKHLDMNWETPRIQQVPMLLEELKEIHGLPGMVKIIEGVMPEVRSRLQTATPSDSREKHDAKQALKQLKRLKQDEPDSQKYFRIFVTLVSSRSAVQREILALGRGLSVPHAQLQHDNLLACVQHLFDSDNCLSFDSAPERAKAETWLAWEYFHLGKMQGQAMDFYRRQSPLEAFGMNDPVKETEKLYRILDGALGEERSYLAGSGAGKFSVADIAVFGWVNVAYYSGINLERFPNVKIWWKRILERPTMEYTLERTRTKIRAKYNAGFLEALQRTPQFREQEESLRDGMREAVRRAKKAARLQLTKSQYGRKQSTGPS